jgi:hypothetical protein
MLVRELSNPVNARPALCALLPISALCGILSGLRWPQTYTISHMVIDYHFGFGKRGLIGLILEHIDRPPYHYVTLAWMAFAVFVVWVGLLVVSGWRGIRTDTGIGVGFLLFFLSAGFACLVCDIGRGEHFGLALAMICLLLPAAAPMLAVRAVLLAAAVLMQEINCLIVVPVVAFDVWVGCRNRQSYRPVLWAIAAAMPATLLTWYLGNVKTACDLGAALPYFQKMLVDFKLAWVPVATLCRDGRANFADIESAVWSVPTQVATLPLALIAALPSTLFNLWLAFRVLRGRLPGRLACLVATLPPLALLLFGADVVRFVTLIQVTSLLVLLSAARRAGLPREGTLPPTPRRAAAVVVLVGFELGSSLTLNDGSPMLKFPFQPLVQRAVAIAGGTQPFVVIPPY